LNCLLAAARWPRMPSGVRHVLSNSFGLELSRSNLFSTGSHSATPTLRYRKHLIDIERYRGLWIGVIQRNFEFVGACGDFDNSSRRTPSNAIDLHQNTDGTCRYRLRNAA